MLAGTLLATELLTGCTTAAVSSQEQGTTDVSESCAHTYEIGAITSTLVGQVTMMLVVLKEAPEKITFAMTTPEKMITGDPHGDETTTFELHAPGWQGVQTFRLPDGQQLAATTSYDPSEGTFTIDSCRAK